MIWMSLSLLAAFSSATNDALTKKILGGLSRHEMAGIRLAYTIPWMSAALAVIEWPQTDGIFWMAFVSALPLEIAAFLIYMESIKHSPLSLTIPFLAFTPAFVIATGWVLLGERVSLGGIAGILLIVTGSYMLNLSSFRSSLLGPVKRIFREKGSALMLVVALIYAFTSTLGKLAINHSSPAFFAAFYYIFLSSALLVICTFSSRAGLLPVLKHYRMGVLLGAIAVVSAFSHMIAISQIQAAYMIGIKRTSILIAVLYGAWLFREEKITERLSGAVLMLVGVMLIGMYA